MVCPFTPHDYILGSVYGILFLVSFYYSVDSWKAAKRRDPNTQNSSNRNNDWCLRIFFVSLSLQCFALSPSYLPCKRDLVGSGPTWLDILVNTPAVFEISTFSTLIRAFASSYHVILKSGMFHKKMLTAVTALLVIINVGAYLLLATSYVFFAKGDGSTSGSKFYTVAVAAVSVASGVLGVCFVCYGCLIMQMQWRLFYSKRYSSHSTSTENEEYHIRVEAKSPLVRMTLIALVCAVCFLLRSCLLLASVSLRNFDVQAHVPTSALYFVMCEIVPSILMIYLFRKRRAEMNSDRASVVYSAPLYSEAKSPYSSLSHREKWQQADDHRIDSVGGSVDFRSERGSVATATDKSRRKDPFLPVAEGDDGESAHYDEENFRAPRP